MQPSMPLPPITPDMTVEAVLSRHPAMLAAFADAGFKPLLNPVLRRLFASVTTLEGAARKKRWNDERLVAFVERLNEVQRSPTAGAAPPTASHEPALEQSAPAARHAWGVFIDNRGLEPPQPMLRILGLLETLGPEERLVAHNDREPIMLLPRLAELGWAYTLDPQPDGSCRVTIHRP